MRQPDHGVESRRVAGLPFGGDAHQFDPRQPIYVEEIWIERGHEATVLVTEDDDEAVDAAGGQQVEITNPISFIVEAALEIGALHGVHRYAALRQEGLFRRVADVLKGVGGGTPGHPVGRVQRRVHQPARVASR